MLINNIMNVTLSEYDILRTKYDEVNMTCMLLTSIFLETIILLKQNFNFKQAIKTALGMSFISMISMEITMNFIDYILIGEAKLTWWVVPIMLTAGFLTPWPYNYWRLKKFNLSCH